MLAHFYITQASLMRALAELKLRSDPNFMDAMKEEQVGMKEESKEFGDEAALSRPVVGDGARCSTRRMLRRRRERESRAADISQE